MRFRRSLRGYDPQDTARLIKARLQKIEEVQAANQLLREKIMECDNLAKLTEKIKLEDIHRFFGMRNAN
jgi:hypothetical protein